MKKYSLTILLVALLSLTGQAQTVSWSTFVDSINNFSSPHLAELTGDGVLDVVIGGGLEDNARNHSVSAFDGATGDILWHTWARNQIFGSAIFLDITNDGTPEAFIGGRGAVFMAIDGKTGDVVWEFYPEGNTSDPAEAGLYNFYNAQLIPDQNGDGLQDILVGNGGDKFAGPLDFDRPAGHLMVISAKDGAQLAKAKVPDEKEVYMSALVHDFDQNGSLEIIYGTGGETIGGSLWKTSLSAVMIEDISGSVELVNGGNKGIIAVPTLADMNQDGTKDIIANMYGRRIVAINGATNDILWEHEVEMGETVASPVVGLFNDDFVPDVFSIYGIGLSPTFREFQFFMFDGLTGEILYQETTQDYSLISPLACDYDGDGVDEVIFTRNKAFSNGPPFQHYIRLLDFNDNKQSELVSYTDGAILGPTPWIGDMDGDGLLEMVYTHHSDATSPKPSKGINAVRVDLPAEKPQTIASGAYMGTNLDGIYDNTYYSCPDEFSPSFGYDGRMCNGQGSVSLTMLDGTPPYTVSLNNRTFAPQSSATFERNDLTAGNYIFKVVDKNGCVAEKKVGIKPTPIPLSATLSASNEAGAITNEAGIDATVEGGLGTYSYLWSTGATTSSLNGLGFGDYMLTVTDQNGCSVATSISIKSTGLEDADQLVFSTYPNPTTDRFQINTPDNGIFEASLYDVKGQLQWTGKVSKQTWIDTPLGTGVYFLILAQKDKRGVSKIVIQ